MAQRIQNIMNNLSTFISKLYDKYFKANSIDKFDKAILKAKIARDSVKSYIKKMERSKDKNREFAKEKLKKAEKESAKYYLSISKAFESQIQVGYGQLSMLENQIIMIDQSKSEIQAIKALEDGNNLLKKLQSEISIEKWINIEQDMENIRENKKELDLFFINNGYSLEEADHQIDEEIEKMENQNLILPDVSNKSKINLKQKEINEKEDHNDGFELLDV